MWQRQRMGWKLPRLRMGCWQRQLVRPRGLKQEAPGLVPELIIVGTLEITTRQVGNA